MTPTPIAYDWTPPPQPPSREPLLPTILPPNATRQERQIESAGWRLDSTGPNGIRSTWQPKNIAAPILPWLAWGLATDGWDTTQPIEVLRAAVAGSVGLHRIKGTLEGFRRLARLYGAEVVKVDRPPSALIAAPSTSPADRDAQLQTYPQLRIQTDTTRRIKPWGSICLGRDVITPANSFLVPSIGKQLVAYLWENGAQTPLSIFRATLDGQLSQEYVEVRLPAPKAGMFCGGTLGSGPLAIATALNRYYVVATSFNYLPGANVRYKTAIPGITPNYVYPDRLAVAAPARGLFTKRGFVGQPLARSTATDRLFSVVYLFSGTNTANTQPAAGRNSFLNGARLGMPSYTAILRVSFTTIRNKAAFGPWLRGSLIPRDNARLDRFVGMLSWGKSARDKILLDTQCYQEISASTVLTASPELISGSMISRN